MTTKLPLVGASSVPATTVAPDPAKITVEETLALLDGPHSAVAHAIANAGYAFWLGSGISRGRLDDLKALIRRALRFLSARVSGAPDPFRAAIDEALAMTELPPADLQSIDVAQAPASWPLIDEIEKRLVSKYSMFLDIRVGTEPADYLLWEAAEAASVFGSPTDPDCEHLCLALLALEGVAPAILSANWDGLVESALQELGAPPGSVQVCVSGEDLRNSRPRARLLKFHGCAVRAMKDPLHYRELLIARRSQITNWKNGPAYQAIRADMELTAMTMRTLMIGLSAQDENIQTLFDDAKQKLAWQWPTDAPAFIFASGGISAHHKNILVCGYEKSYDSNHHGIHAKSFIPAYGKPLLLAIVLNVLCTKLEHAAERGAMKLDEKERQELSAGLRVLRDAAAAKADANSIDSVRRVWTSVSCAMQFLQTGQASRNAGYSPISVTALQAMLLDPNIATSGLPEAAAILALLGDGASKQLWRVDAGDLDDPAGGAIAVESPRRGRFRVFCVANGTAYVALLHSGVVSETTKDAIVFHSALLPFRTRSPKAAPGRTGRRRLTSVEVPTLLESASTLDALRTQFRQEAAL